jgi:hypothetical protein
LSYTPGAIISKTAARPMPVIINTRELLAFEGSGIKYFSRSLTSALSAMNLKPVALLDKVKTSKSSTNNHLESTNIYQLHGQGGGMRLERIYEEAKW